MSTEPPTEEEDKLGPELEVIDALIEKAMEPWDARLSPERRVQIRAALVEALATHPTMTSLIAQLLPPPVVEESGEVDADGNPVAEDRGEEAPGRSGTK